MKAAFPRTCYVANAIELFERLAFYGMYVGLSPYLSKVVGIGARERGGRRAPSSATSVS